MLVSGKKHGEWRHYFESGVISIFIIYEHGVKEGKSYWFHPNSNIGWEENYIQGIPHGKFLYYDEKGQLRIERVFEKGKEESYIFDGKELKKN
jgi:antitoxin component YwqK of YwqJK toxin-antitoxin module